MVRYIWLFLLTLLVGGCGWYIDRVWGIYPAGEAIYGPEVEDGE